MMLFLLLPEFMGPGIKVWKWRWYHYYSHSESLAKLLLPIPVTIHSANIVVLVTKGGMFSLGDTTMMPLNLNTPSQAFCTSHASVTTHKEGHHDAGWSD